MRIAIYCLPPSREPRLPMPMATIINPMMLKRVILIVELVAVISLKRGS